MGPASIANNWPPSPSPTLLPLLGSGRSPRRGEDGAGEDPHPPPPIIASLGPWSLQGGTGFCPHPQQGIAHLCRLFLRDPESDLEGHKRVLLSLSGVAWSHKSAQPQSQADRGERRSQGSEGTCLCGASSHSSSSCAGVRSSHSCGHGWGGGSSELLPRQGQGQLDMAGKSGRLGHLAEASCPWQKVNRGHEGQQGP